MTRQRIGGLHILYMLLFLSMLLAPVRGRAVSESGTLIDARNVAELVSDNWKKGYFLHAVVTPGSMKVKVDGQYKSFTKVFGTSRKKAAKAVRSTSSIMQYFRRAGGIYGTRTRSDGSVYVTAPFQMQRLVVLFPVSDNYGAVRVLHTRNDHDTILQFDSQEKTRAAFDKIRARFGRNSCYPDRYLQLSGGDLSQASLMEQKVHSWGVSYMQMDQLKNKAYARTDLAPVTVAMIDSGINKDSVFFEEGRIHAASRSFTGDAADYSDSIGHGTHVAGVIAEATPSNTQLMMLKVTNQQGKASFLTIREALWYAISRRANVINFSMGSMDDTDMSILNGAIDTAVRHGIPICAAAGNQSCDVKKTYPANVSDVISVSAFTSGMERASYSNYGKLIDFSAPGDKIVGASCRSNKGLTVFSGTSMAAPHISAACAYIKMLRPSASVDLVVAELRRLSVDLGTPGKDNLFGYGCPVLGTLFDTNILSREIIYTGRPGIIGLINTKKAVLISWTPVRNARKYYIYRKKKGGSYTLVKKVSGSRTLWYDRKTKSGVKYTYKIKAKIKSKKYTSFGKKASLIRLKVPGSFRASARTGEVIMSWKKVRGSKGCQIQLSLSPDFCNPVYCKVSGKRRTASLSNLAKGIYYVRIRSVRGSSCSAWSSICAVEVP